MHVFFCDSCGTRVSDDDLSRGLGIRREDVIICHNCISKREELSAVSMAETTAQDHATMLPNTMRQGATDESAVALVPRSVNELASEIDLGTTDTDVQAFSDVSDEGRRRFEPERSGLTEGAASFGALSSGSPSPHISSLPSDQESDQELSASDSEDLLHQHVMSHLPQTDEFEQQDAATKQHEPLTTVKPLARTSGVEVTEDETSEVSIAEIQERARKSIANKRQRNGQDGDTSAQALNEVKVAKQLPTRSARNRALGARARVENPMMPLKPQTKRARGGTKTTKTVGDVAQATFLWYYLSFWQRSVLSLWCLLSTTRQ